MSTGTEGGTKLSSHLLHPRRQQTLALRLASDNIAIEDTYPDSNLDDKQSAVSHEECSRV